MIKSYKILKFAHLTMKVDGQPGLIYIMGFIMHIYQLLLGAHVDGSVDIKKCCIFKKLKIVILASGSVLAQGVMQHKLCCTFDCFDLHYNVCVTL